MVVNVRFAWEYECTSCHGYWTSSSGDVQQCEPCQIGVSPATKQVTVWAVWEYMCSSCHVSWINRHPPVAGQQLQCGRCHNGQMVLVEDRLYQLTPYQGYSRCFGKFKCGCNNIWTSGNSWADTWQMCSKCKKTVYPFLQRRLQRGLPRPNRGESKPHPQALCQRCIEQGKYCSEKRKSREV